MPLFIFYVPGQEIDRPTLAFPVTAPDAWLRVRPRDHAAGRRAAGHRNLRLLAPRQGERTVSQAGRPQNPLPSGPAAPVCAELRRQREEAKLTYRGLADLAGYSLASVTAALNGRKLPSWNVTRACVTACGGDEDAMRTLYEQACLAEGRPVPQPAAEAGAGPPDPSRAETPEQLLACMACLRAWADNPSLAELNRRSEGHLPESTVSGVLRRKTLPRRDLVRRYAAACGLSGPEAARWEAAWDRIKGAAVPSANGASGQGSPPGQEPGGGSPPPGPWRTLPQPRRGEVSLSSLIARVLAFVLPALFALFLSPATLPASLASSAPSPGPVTVTVRLAGPGHFLQQGLSRGDSHVLAETIAWARTQTPHQADKIISPSAEDQVIVGNLLDTEGAAQDIAGQASLAGTYLEALDLEGSGTVSTTTLALGGLPDGTAVGILPGTGQALGNCSTARWYIASSMPLIPDSTVCIFRPSSPGTASLLSIRQQSARAIALSISSWSRASRPATARSAAPGADLADSAP
jgi:Helix-turn-helix domain